MNKLTPAQKSAATREKNRLAARPSIADYATYDVATHTFAVDGVDGLSFTCGSVEHFNTILERLGYKPVRITHNMLNVSGKVWLIDADTPRYCDPGSEAYHSM